MKAVTRHASRLMDYKLKLVCVQSEASKVAVFTKTLKTGAAVKIVVSEPVNGKVTVAVKQGNTEEEHYTENINKNNRASYMPSSYGIKELKDRYSNGGYSRAFPKAYNAYLRILECITPSVMRVESETFADRIICKLTKLSGDTLEFEMTWDVASQSSRYAIHCKYNGAFYAEQDKVLTLKNIRKKIAELDFINTKHQEKTFPEVEEEDIYRVVTHFKKQGQLYDDASKYEIGTRKLTVDIHPKVTRHIQLLDKLQETYEKEQTESLQVKKVLFLLRKWGIAYDINYNEEMVT